MFSLKPPRPTFRSYLLPPPQTDDKINSEPKIKKLEPVLLPGEIVVNEVNFVRKCIAADTSQYDLWGKLVCSNFRISFLTDDPMPLQKFHYRNLLLGEHDVPLTCIEQIVTINDHKRKQKVLGPNQKLKFNPTELIIYCKDFRIVRFRFDESGPESAKKWKFDFQQCFSLSLFRAFLKHSAELVYMLESKRVSVVLQEEEGRDLSCIVASLVQVMLDPYFRTITGFQSLIQKEWVMAGYQFLDRCNHLKRSEKESPLFLLFLDATWQLLEQHPAAFEFSETYLAVLGDSTHISLFGTFLFNSPHQRVKQSTEFAISKNIQLGDEKGLRFPSVWDWSLQFTAKDRTLFHNPSYVGKSTPCMQNGSVKPFKRTKKTYSSTLRGLPSSPENGVIRDQEFLPRRSSLILRGKPDPLQPAGGQDGGMERYFREWFARPADPHGVLLPQLSGTHIKLWKLCYFRWVPEAQIARGGSITAFHRLSLLADEVDVLSRTLRQPGAGPLQAGFTELDQSRMYFQVHGPHDTPAPPEFLSSSFPFSPVGNLCRRSILGTPLSKFLSGAKIWLSTETLANED
ncbi:PREDICTED: myotubularin-related protein 10 [Hipposideros armiger]|uniref:Myotubularin-related protein 10 n=1 Tax=Hipposideros armiger TaxID=186990 RepID=A0A8B7PW62_HIPAR|nr:PREDICTED: myotubularin-related protein 10 [Hipposideros armiger]